MERLAYPEAYVAQLEEKIASKNKSLKIRIQGKNPHGVEAQDSLKAEISELELELASAKADIGE